MSAIYSQGFNFTSFIQKGVDPRTGQYTCAVAVIGEPKPCSSLRGENYQVTETTSSVAVKDQKLKSFQFKKNGNRYEVIHKSGQVEVLSNASNTYNTTVPIELHSPTGRQLKLVWVNHGEQPRLQKIKDGIDTLLDIEYGDALVRITRAPNTAEASTLALARRGGRLIELRLPLDGSPSWKFDYDQDAYLTKVKNPAGLEEDIVYTKKGHQLPRGAPQEYIPYVSLHTQSPGNGQPAIKTRYSFSNKNFLGFGSGFDWKEGEDNLYRTREDYRYSSTVQVDGGATTKYTYNRFHLLLSSEMSKGVIETTQTTIYHMLNGRFDEQPAQYQLPKSVQTTYQDTTRRSQRVETTQYAFDDWGNSTQVIQPTGVKIDREYYPPAGEADHCPGDPHKFQRHLKCTTVTPAPSTFKTPISRHQIVYSQLPTAAGAAYASYFVASKEEKTHQDDQEIASLQRSYVNEPASRDHGRLAQDTTRVAGKYPTTTSWTYQRPTLGRLTQATEIKNFDGSTINETASFSLLSGLVLMHQDSAGVQTDFEYDLTGQLVKKTISPGTQYEATERIDYIIVSDKAGYRVTMTDTKGVQTRYFTDGLQRVCRVEEQDDQNQVFRLVQEHTYDSLGQCTAVVDTDWIRTAASIDPVPQQRTRLMSYDDWGHVCRVTESDSVVTSTFMDPVTLTCREDVNGQNKRLTRFNNFGAPTKISLLNRDDSVYATAESMYDGLGRLVEQRDAMGRTTQYQLDVFDRITRTTWPGSRVVDTAFDPQTASAFPISIETNKHVLAGQSFDGLGRVTSRQVGGRTAKNTYEGSAPKPATVITPKGDAYKLTYEPHLNYALMKSLGVNDQSNYRYDAKSFAPLQLDDSYCTNSLDYLPSGLLSKETVCFKNGPKYSATSTYSMAGRLQSYTDPNGQRQEIQYDDQGRPQRLAQGALNVTYAYDDASRLSTSSVQKEGGTSLTTRLAYDDFGREIKRTVSKGNETLYQSSQTYYETGHAKTRCLEDGKGQSLRQEIFQYDELDRLVDYQCTGPQSPTNEKGLQLQRQSFAFGSYDNLTQITSVFQDGSRNVAEYLYNAQDVTQVTLVTNTHPSYDARVDLKYDQNGCLIQDDQLNKLEYDAMSRLTAVTDRKGNLRSQYHYDASGKLVGQVIPGKAEYHLHYRGDKLIGFTSGDQQVSYVSDGARYWGQISKQGNSTDTETWASDGHESIMALIGNDGSEHYQQYTPYGFSNLGDGQNSPSVGFNGQWRDPVTGWYHLGNGYRVYNPVLMVFHSPDSWSPFTSGEINPYAYCLGDPINRIDPSGHFSLFGIEFTWRDVAIMAVGLAVGIAFGVATGGAGFAIEVGLGIAVGAASDVVTGMVYDGATGKGISWSSVGTDAAYGVIGGLVGEGVGRAIGAAGKAAIRGLKGAHEAVSTFVRSAEKLKIAGGKPKAKLSLAPETSLRTRPRVPEIDELHGRIQRAARVDMPDLPTLREQLETLRNTHFNRPEANKTYTWRDPASIDQRLSETEIDKYNHFRDLVRRQGLHPRSAAGEIGDSDFKLLDKNQSQYQLRLSRSGRVSFTFVNNVIDDFQFGHT
ncbi:uncharacterized protein TrAtP1_000204 [Trichoderma atroviride]|uniref:uncharacterized protein n=1 Tax=Hypocrea atroviridis TaxID=63577 RepID=UPI003320D463|nr:hypothetical protein TrAtP1_000204 [Trichoderma atroviride]